MYDKVKREKLIGSHFGCSMADIAETVVLTPVWSLEAFKAAADEVLTEFSGWYDGLTLKYKGKRLTVIESRIGSPLSGDCALALGYADCENIIFSGSAGAINMSYNIGDMLSVSEAVIGEGFSRYHSEDITRDRFGETAAGDRQTAGKVMDTLKKYEDRYGIKCYEGKIFSIDSILGERKETFDFMQLKGCDAVEMEVSAVFTACSRVDIKAAALILISDHPLRYQNLFEGIAEEGIKKYNAVKKALPGIIMEAAESLK